MSNEAVENILVERYCQRNGWEYSSNEDYDNAVRDIKWFMEQSKQLGYKRVPELRMLTPE